VPNHVQVEPPFGDLAGIESKRLTKYTVDGELRAAQQVAMLSDTRLIGKQANPVRSGGESLLVAKAPDTTFATNIPVLRLVPGPLSRRFLAECIAADQLYFCPQFVATNVSITCRASGPSSDLENAIAPNFKSFPSEVRLNWKTYSATSSMHP